MRKIAAAFLLVLITLGSFQPPSARAQMAVIDSQVDYTFGGQVTFTASIQSDNPIESVQVFFQSAGTTITSVGTATPDPSGAYVCVFDLTRDQPLKAFTSVTYWFRVTPQSGEVFTSPEFNFFYEDNRFDWQVLEDGPFQVYWYDGDAAVGQMALDTAISGIQQKIKPMLPEVEPEQVKIYIYASATEMQSASRLAGSDWVAGHADTDIGVIVVSLPTGPGQRSEAQRQIPHELMHILLSQTMGPNYSHLPKWLNEGLASLAELSPNPDYEILLASAVEKDQLIPLASLCQVFPQDAASVYLSYAESYYFTRYLQETFGVNNLQALINRYADGLDCETGTEAIYGMPLSKLEMQWQREALGHNQVLAALGELFPWLVILALVLAAPLALVLIPGSKSRHKAAAAAKS